jgi:hypothetical protein
MHIALRDQFLHFHVQGKEIPEYIMTSENTADIGTKALQKKAFLKHRKTLLGEEITDQYFKSKPL